MSAQEGFAEVPGQDKGRSPAIDDPTGGRGALRLPYLDGLRALAASYVVLFHALPGFSAPQLTGHYRLLRRLFAYGHEAVAIFIVLSGYCLMLPIVRKDPARLGVTFGPFIRRRAKRILPPYFAALAASLVLLASLPSLRAGGTGTIWDDSLPGLDVGAIVSHVLVIHNWFPSYGYQINGPLWSVASEWQIYFFFPLVLVPLWRRVNAPGTLAAAAVLGYAPLLFAPAAARVAIPWYLLLFTFGMVAASIGFGNRELEQRLHARAPWGLISGALWLACVVSSNALATLWFRFKPLADPLIGLATAALLIQLTRQSIASKPGKLLALLQSRPLVAIGHFSYSLYLTHLPVLALCYLWLRHLGLSGAPFLLAIAGLGSLTSVLLAYGFHLVFERPFMKRS